MSSAAPEHALSLDASERMYLLMTEFNIGHRQEGHNSEPAEFQRIGMSGICCTLERSKSNLTESWMHTQIHRI